MTFLAFLTTGGNAQGRTRRVSPVTVGLWIRDGHTLGIPKLLDLVHSFKMVNTAGRHVVVSVFLSVDPEDFSTRQHLAVFSSSICFTSLTRGKRLLPFTAFCASRGYRDAFPSPLGTYLRLHRAYRYDSAFPLLAGFNRSLPTRTLAPSVVEERVCTSYM